jgi:hypothetical protein
VLQHRPTVPSILEKMQGDRFSGFEPVDHRTGRHDPAHRIEHRHHGGPETCDTGAQLTNAQSSINKPIFPI